MTRLQEAIGLGLVLGALHGVAASAVPVVPKFHTGLHDQPYGDDSKDYRDHQFDGLQYRISIFSNWFWC